MLRKTDFAIIIFLTALIIVFTISCEEIIEPLPSVNPHDSQANNFVPDSPSGLNIVQNSDKSIDIYWKNNSYDYSKFIIERRDRSNPYMILGEVPKDSTHFRDITGLKIENTYSYRIGTVAENGNIGYSAERGFKLTFLPPSNVIATDSQRTSIFLQWKDQTDFEKGFIIEKRIGNSSFLEIARTGADITNYLDTDSDTNQTATYRVRAFTDINISDTSKNIKVNFDPELTQYGSIITGNFSDFDLSKESNLIVAIGAYGGGVFLYSSETGALLKILPTLINYPYDLAVSPDGATIALAVGDMIELWDANTGELIRTLATNSKIVKFSPDGRYLASSALTDSTTLWDTNSWTIFRKFIGSGPAQFISGAELLTTITMSGNNSILYFCNIASNQVISTVTLPQRIGVYSHYSFSEDGRLILYCNTNGLFITRIPDLKIIFQNIIGYSNWMTSTFSPSGRIFAAGSNGGFIDLWRFSDQKIIWTQRFGAYDGVYKILFDKYETKMLALCDKGIRQWSIKYKWKQAN